MKHFKLLLLFIIPFFLTGCLNYTELNELGITESLGIEKIDDSYLVSINLIDAKSENDDMDELRKSYEAKGSTITEAIQNLYLKSSKKIYLSHIEVLLLSEEIAKENISLLIDFFLRNQESRNSFTTIIVKDTTPREIIYDKEKNPEINDIIQINSEEYGISALITFEDFSRMILEEGIDAVLPVIKLDEERLEVDGYAYFQDQKWIGYLSKEESITYNLLKNKNSHIVLSHSCDNKKTNVKIEQLNTTQKSKKNKITIEVNGNLSITENQCELKDNEILTIFEDKIKNNIETLLKRQQNEKIDILGLQSLIRQNNYIYYQQQKNKLQNILSYQTNINLTYLQSDFIKGEITNEE